MNFSTVYSKKTMLLFVTLLPFLLPVALEAQCIAGHTGGVVWRDFNNDGIKDATETVGIEGVTVRAFDDTGSLIATATTNTLGQYTLGVLATAPSAANKLRIEFSNVPAPYTPTFNGTNGRTDVQIISAVSCAVNYGLNDPADYCQAVPNIVTSCYLFGNQITGGNNAGSVLISFPNNAGNTSLTAADATYDVPSTHTTNMKANQIGTTWGLAYAKKTQKLYAASFFKKHTGFGKGADGTANTADDAGAIYVINPTTNLVTSTFTVPNATTNRHNTADYLVDNGNIAWDAVGKTSLGGMDLSDDEDSLFVMNLEDRMLYALNPTTGVVLGSVAMPTTLSGCGAAGDARPFAVEYYKSRLYVGIICSGESNQAATSVNAYVYEVNPTTMTMGASPVFQMDMDYPRGKANNDVGQIAAWKPWKTTFANIVADNTVVVYPQPLLTSLAFDKEQLILGFRDRVGDQVGQYAPDNPALPATNYEPRAAGDILRACGSLNAWTLESNGRCGGTGSATQNTGQGPGNGEFYNGDAYSYDFNGVSGIGNTHDEIILGGVLQIQGFPNVVATVYDPIPSGSAVFDGGVRWQSNTTGNLTQSYRLYDDVVAAGDLGKANGLGDLVALCNAQPLQIGNYVWLDQNKNGVQDPNETPIDNVTVALWKGATQIASTTTNANGEYYFSSKYVLGAAWTGTGVDTTLLPNTAYEVRISATQSAITTPNYFLTTANSTTNGGNDQNDSDATLIGTNAVIAFTAGAAGSTNHTYDFGFVPCSTITNPSTTQTICAGASGTDITVKTNINAANSIRFVKFTTDLMVGGTPDGPEATAIYAGTAFATVTPVTNGTDYTATYTWNSTDFPNATTAPITYYVYAILNPDLGVACRPVQEIQVIVNANPMVPTLTSPMNNSCPTTSVNLTTRAATLNPSIAGGVFEWHTANTSSSSLVPTPTAVGNGTYYLFEKSPVNCYSTGTAATVAIQVCCPATLCLPVTAIRNN